MKTFPLLFIGFLVFLFGCSKSVPIIKSADLEVKSIEIAIADSATDQRVYAQSKTYVFNGKQYLAYLPVKRDSVYLYDLDSRNKERAYNIPLISGEIEISDFDMLSIDSLAYLSSNTNSVIFANAKGQYARYIFSAPIPVYNTNGVLSPPISVVGDKIFVAIYPSTPVVGKEERSKYFNTPRDIILKAHDSVLSIVKQTSIFPDVYREKYFYSFNPVRTITNDRVIYSFEVSHQIETYDLKELSRKTIEIESYNFNERPEFDENKLMDYSYIANYLHESDRYFSLIYDPWHQKFIRVQQKSSDKNLKADGSVNNDNEHNILVYDHNFNLEKVINFPDEGKYDFRKVLMSQNGILLKLKVPESTKLHALKYDQFKLY